MLIDQVVAPLGNEAVWVATPRCYERVLLPSVDVVGEDERGEGRADEAGQVGGDDEDVVSISAASRWRSRESGSLSRIDRGTLVKTVFDHASIPATVRALFAPAAPALTKRDREAATFHGIVEESTRRSPRTSPGTATNGDLPDLSRLTQRAPTPTTRGGEDAEGSDTLSGDALRLEWLSDQVEAELTRRPPRPSGEVRSVRSGGDPTIVVQVGNEAASQGQQHAVTGVTVDG